MTPTSALDSSEPIGLLACLPFVLVATVGLLPGLALLFHVHIHEKIMSGGLFKPDDYKTARTSYKEGRSYLLLLLASTTFSSSVGSIGTDSVDVEADLVVAAGVLIGRYFISNVD